jgi:hypothetical protein
MAEKGGPKPAPQSSQNPCLQIGRTDAIFTVEGFGRRVVGTEVTPCNIRDIPR